MRSGDIEKGWHDFLELCSKIKALEEFKNFFMQFLTAKERALIKSRYLIIKALLEDRLTQREIAKTYHVSIKQIIQGENALKMIDPEFKKFLKNNLDNDFEGYM